VFAGAARVDKVDAPTVQLSVAALGFELDTGAGQTRSIDGEAIAQFDLPVKGIDRAGIYSIETLFADATGKYLPHTTKTTVYLRESGWRAVLAILVGAVLAWFIRYQVSDGNQRLALRRRIALLEEHIRVSRGSARAEELIAAARMLELDIADRDRDARWGGKVDDLEKIVGRAELRFALLQDIATASTQVVRIDADKQADLRRALEIALTVVRIDPGTEDKINAAREAVAGLALRAIRRDQLRNRLADLRSKIDAQRRVGTPTLVGALDRVMESLARADQLLTTDDLDKLDELIAQAREAVLDACRAEFLTLADGKAPLGAEANWPVAAKEMKSALDNAGAQQHWEAKNKALQLAQRVYVTTAMTGLAQTAKNLAAAGDSRADDLRKMALDLETTPATDILAATELYAKYFPTVSAPDPQGFSHGLVGREDGQRTVNRAAGAMPLAFAADAGGSAHWRPSEVTELNRRISSYRWLVNAGVLVIAVGTGIKVLWLDNLSWGGESAWLLAFLWGASVQVTGDAFAGVVALRLKLGALVSPS
jgi:hypothetical protein